MKAFCPVCSAGYPIPDDKVKDNGLPVKCKRCGAVFRVFPDNRETIVQSEPTVPEAQWREAEPQPKPAKKKKKSSAARESEEAKKVVKSTALDEKPVAPEPSLPMKEEIPAPAEVVPEPEPEPVREPEPEPEPEPEMVVAEAEELAEDEQTAYAEVEAVEVERPPQTDFDMPPRLAKKKADQEFEDDDFMKVDRPIGIRTFLIGAVIVAVVAVIVVVILSIVRESGEVLNNVKKRDEAAQVSYEDAKKKLDYATKFQNGQRAMDAGSVEGYAAAVEWFDKSLVARAEYLPALAGKASALALAAVEYEKADGVDEACKLADEALAKNEKAAEALRAKAACLLAQGKLDEADQSIQRALTAVEGDNAEDANSNYVLALIYVAKKDLDKALYTLKSVIALNPLHFRAYHQLADLYATRRAWQLALDAENKALSINSHNEEAKRRIEFYNEQLSGKLKETTLVPGMSAEMGSELDKKKTAESLQERIRSAMRRGSTNEALGLINELLKLGTHTGTAYMQKCQLLVNSNQRDAALDACSVARNYNPDAYYFLGALYEIQGNTAMKEQNYRAYLLARPNGNHAAEVRSILGMN